ncbi:RNA polymerase sigma factor [Streptomonospora salina]|uniref:RNA polymerase sigma-70 factor (ECF subfamily) n=1 Tax=Streptomonospora salina TaxID=104205 RepID=A0A841EB15_9ACTN|nr:RNA polymerase sigma factor [Streptomonospora salina]MBB6000202.1 RNA polymerase sigma-70 factor (ECF subfamily) [Streptomonospora salina]
MCYVQGVDPEQQLLAQVASGDEGGLRELYHRHSAAMLRLLGRLTSDAGTAEEILQEAWLAVWRSAGSYRASASVRAWLLGIARRQAHNRLRRAAAPAVDIDAAPEPADRTADVESRVLASAGHEAILAAIARLPEAHRDVVVLALVEELPYADIAEVLRVPVGTVKSRMSTARRTLSAELSRERVN